MEGLRPSCVLLVSFVVCLLVGQTAAASVLAPLEVEGLPGNAEDLQTQLKAVGTPRSANAEFLEEQQESDAPRYTVDPTRKGDCPNCHWLKEGKVNAIAWTEKDKIDFAKQPAQKTKHIVKILGQLRKQSDTQDAAVVADIARDKHLLKLYGILKKQMKHTLKKINGYVPPLPSEDSTYIDASGKHWGKAEYKDSRRFLIDQQKASLRKDSKKKKQPKFKKVKGMAATDQPAEKDVSDCPDPTKCNLQSQPTPKKKCGGVKTKRGDCMKSMKGMTPARVGNVVTHQLPAQCPCSCPVQQCPCKCPGAVLAQNVPFIRSQRAIPPVTTVSKLPKARISALEKLPSTKGQSQPDKRQSPPKSMLAAYSPGAKTPKQATQNVEKLITARTQHGKPTSDCQPPLCITSA